MCISIADYNNNQLDDSLLISSTAALATHDYTNRSLVNASEDRCFPCTYQGCLKVILIWNLFISYFMPSILTYSRLENKNNYSLIKIIFILWSSSFSWKISDTIFRSTFKDL